MTDSRTESYFGAYEGEWRTDRNMAKESFSTLMEVYL